MPSISPTLARNVVAATALAVAAAIPTIQKWEGLRLDPYNDIANIRTVCWGETRNVQERRYAKAECDALLMRSVNEHAAPILACLPVDAPLNVKAAFIIFGYNVGPTAACRSTAARLANSRNYPAACNALLAWNKVRDPSTNKLVVSRGLTNRRLDERKLCLTP